MVVKVSYRICMHDKFVCFPHEANSLTRFEGMILHVEY